MRSRSSFPEPLSSGLDAAYSPSRLVPGYRSILACYRQLSDAAKRELPCELNVRYGDGEGELLHYFPPARPGSPLLAYVHGGHWQELSIDDSCFPATGMVAAGAGFVAIGYRLAPEGRLDGMAASVAKALEWVVERAAGLGTDPERVHVAGSSAGAHLVAMALGSGPAAAAVEVAGLALLSGVYELSGVRRTYVNAALGLSEEDAERNSPLRHLPLRARRVLLARGEVETAEYSRQQAILLAALGSGERGGARVSSLVCGGRNHFDLPLGLGNPAEELGRAMLAQMRLGPRAL